MSHLPWTSDLPWMAQEALGTAARSSGGSSSSAGRVANPTASTPATFGENLNWDHAENGPTDPTPEEGVCTFMGPSTSHLSGNGRGHHRAEGAHLIKAALDIMRKHGYRCQLPPEGWVDEDGDEDDDEVEEGGGSKKSNEMAYLEDRFYEDIMVLGKQTDEVVFMMKSSCGWLQIRCAGKEAEGFVEEHLADSEHYVLGKVTHDETSRSPANLPEDISITRRTGGEAQSSEVGARRSRQLSPSSVGTLFELKKGNKVIAKALCSYRNCEMDNPGPTIELFEVAKEWRRHGYGKLLLHEVSSFFEDIFDNIVCSDEVVKYNVCYCTNGHACEWFLRQGFEDWDGMGEELGTYLGSMW